jgi:subtilase family serine protease
MRRPRAGALAAGLILATFALLAPTANAAGTPAIDPAHAAPAAAPASHPTQRACAVAAPGHAACKALLRTDVQVSASAVHTDAATPSGLFPADLQSAYKLPSASAGSGQTVAIVDAFDDPNAESDLATYRSQFGLPPCTTANGCFRKVDQRGGTRFPRTNAGWAAEISLDLDMVSATCPNCKILLVEADSNSFANLGAAENEAAALGANVISNSFGGSDASDATNGAPFNHPGIAITVSSGDSGFGVEYPASSHFVTAVGGTHLTRASNTRGWTETAWNGAGSGCSAFNTALSGQASFNTGCSRRAVADVSAVADPATGVAVFDTVPIQGQSQWLVFGGTSVAAPVVAGVYGLAGNARSIDNNFPYAHASALFDVTSGSNGSCSPSQLCTARAGWDGPTGLGTPNGTGAF